MRRTHAIVAAGLAVGLTLPRLAAAEPTGEPQPVRLEIDLTALPDDRITAELRAFLDETQVGVLEAAGLRVADDAPNTLRVVISRYGEDGVHYRAKLTLDGTAPSKREITCEACLDSELVHRVEIETALLVAKLDSTAAEVETSPEPTPSEPGAQPSSQAPGTEPEATAEPGQRVGPLGYVGIGLAVAGLGSTIGGIVLAAETSAHAIAPDDDAATDTFDRRRQGVAFAGLGVSLMVAGAVSIVVDQTVLRRRRASRSLSFVPTLAPDHAGLAWVGRF